MTKATKELAVSARTREQSSAQPVYGGVNRIRLPPGHRDETANNEGLR